MKAVTNTKALPVERVLDDTSKIFEYPSRLISNRGSAFTSKRFISYCKELNIKHVLTVVATSRANEQVERYNRTILDGLCTSSTEDNKWDK